MTNLETILIPLIELLRLFVQHTLLISEMWYRKLNHSKLEEKLCIWDATLLFNFFFLFLWFWGGFLMPCSAVACLCAADLLAVQSRDVRAPGLHTGKRGGWSGNSFSWAVLTVLRAAGQLGYRLPSAFCV